MRLEIDAFMKWIQGNIGVAALSVRGRCLAGLLGEPPVLIRRPSSGVRACARSLLASGGEPMVIRARPVHRRPGAVHAITSSRFVGECC